MSDIHDPGGRSKPKWPADSVINAVFSDCGLYRYELSEIWNPQLPLCMFLLMNPSVAGIEHADPTLIRTGRFAREWGYGGQLVANIHAYRITDSRRLGEITDPAGPLNEASIINMAHRADKVILGYGMPPRPLRARAQSTVQMLRDAGIAMSYLRLSKDGTPSHPLYLPGNLIPLDYTVPENSV